MRAQRLLAILVVVLGYFLFGSPASAQNTDMGATFESIDVGAQRVVTWFTDSYAIATSGSNGLVSTELFRPDGGRVARMERLGGGGLALQIDLNAVPEVIGVSPQHARQVSKDWHNAQLRRLWWTDVP